MVETMKIKVMRVNFVLLVLSNVQSFLSALPLFFFHTVQAKCLKWNDMIHSTFLDFEV